MDLNPPCTDRKLCPICCFMSTEIDDCQQGFGGRSRFDWVLRFSGSPAGSIDPQLRRNTEKPYDKSDAKLAAVPEAPAWSVALTELFILMKRTSTEFPQCSGTTVENSYPTTSQFIYPASGTGDGCDR